MGLYVALVAENDLWNPVILSNAKVNMSLVLRVSDRFELGQGMG